MTHIIADRVRETTNTIGNGAYNLTGAVIGFDTFASALTTNGDTCWYCAEKDNQWEVGIGTRTSSSTIARTTILASSNSDNLVNFTSPPVIFLTIPAAGIIDISAQARLRAHFMSSN